ncbi:Ppx/GppA phosphatase family protein [Prosthecochloris sp. CIB 2401]|uniref:Ppx/GppA phosphatase family protein n=1 Tax=Prosthecochloris sp. CIB 2401 TaxID=1868325 RepID=UPI00080A9564|nr:phosphatase [Prosthecochloris sp. CIB 2401]ANT65924.1 Guanosine-5'-triphosphate,3'-diphosphate pyrophosphatase [Prosthecochloris sp. CIB 2401]
MKRISCIDIGTNTALMLIADLDPQNNTITPLLHRQQIIRLGSMVDENRIIDHAAKQRLIECLTEYAELCRHHEVEQVIAVGTSALRDAKNRMEVIDEVVKACGIVIKTITGTEEAELTFRGAVGEAHTDSNPYMVIDIGGGSTELTRGKVGIMEHSVSLDIGSVRLTERLFSSQPPSEEEYEKAKTEIDQQFEGNLAPFFESRERVIGVAGTITTLEALALGLREFRAEDIHGKSLRYTDVLELLELFRRSTTEEIVARGVPEGRADVITMGTLILHQFMRLLGVGELQVSIRGLRYGLAEKELHNLRSAETNEQDTTP